MMSNTLFNQGKHIGIQIMAFAFDFPQRPQQFALLKQFGSKLQHGQIRIAAKPLRCQSAVAAFEIGNHRPCRRAFAQIIFVKRVTVDERAPRISCTVMPSLAQ
ncbi:hypothetical protein [Neisseria yangbaofengii]|uniref:hypothetical protein n=1 Tax=Neisseria yangbaofengii TaxID=2709396 RepID=UPI0013E9FDB4|nr:hypothetical protein [Neisseria yangbaofengii]